MRHASLHLLAQLDGQFMLIHALPENDWLQLRSPVPPVSRADAFVVEQSPLEWWVWNSPDQSAVRVFAQAHWRGLAVQQCGLLRPTGVACAKRTEPYLVWHMLRADAEPLLAAVDAHKPGIWPARGWGSAFTHVAADDTRIQWDRQDVEISITAPASAVTLGPGMTCAQWLGAYAAGTLPKPSATPAGQHARVLAHLDEWMNDEPGACH